MKTKTIIITGGHHNSALVVAKLLRSKGWQIAWLGHRYAARGDHNDSAEYEEVTSAGIPFYELKAGKLSAPPRITELLSIPLGFLRAAWLLLKFRPRAVLSFGGYLGLATTIPAFLLGIPVYLHEQTIVGGKANMFAARFARKVYLTWKSSIRYFPAKKSVIIGLPLRPHLLQAKPQQLFTGARPTLLVLGGKQGSHVINETIFKALPELTKHYNVIHQTGMSTVTLDNTKALTLKSAYYLPIGYIGEDQIGSYVATADLVISRAGAHTSYELGVLGKRAILIPFIATTGHEQLEQARLLQAAGIASLLLQADLTPKALLADITHALALPAPIPLSLPREAATGLVDDLLSDLA